MSTDKLNTLLDQIYTGEKSGRILYSRFHEYVELIAKKMGFQQHGIKAAARRSITMLVTRVKRDRSISQWPEDHIQALLCEYADQQWMLHTIRYNNSFMKEAEYATIRKRCAYHIERLADESGKRTELDIETLIEVAHEKVFKIFWEKIKNPEFELTSTISTYVDGLARNVAYELFKPKKPLSLEKDFEPSLNDTYPEDTIQRLFDEIENQLLAFEHQTCQEMLLKCFRLFRQIVDHEEIKAADIKAMRKAMIQELSNVLGIGDLQRPDKAFDHCYKLFVIRSFPVLYTKLGGEFPNVGLGLKSEAQKYAIQHKKEKKSKRDSKRNKGFNVFLLWS